eukprot:jgi/Mesen1/4529/ME000230S03670
MTALGWCSTCNTIQLTGDLTSLGPSSSSSSSRTFEARPSIYTRGLSGYPGIGPKPRAGTGDPCHSMNMSNLARPTVWDTSDCFLTGARVRGTGRRKHSRVASSHDLTPVAVLKAPPRVKPSSDEVYDEPVAQELVKTSSRNSEQLNLEKSESALASAHEMNLPKGTSDTDREVALEKKSREVQLFGKAAYVPAVPKDRKLSKFLPNLVLMRHGESMWNDLKLFTGDVDIPLTENGIKEALSGGKAVGDVDFHMIFTSRLVRSKQTALIAMTQNIHKAVPVIVRGGYHGNGKTGDENRLRLREAASKALEMAECRMIPVYADKALNERCYGDLQGLNKEAAAREFGSDMVKKWRRSHDTRPPRGESLMDTWARATNFFNATIVPRLEEGNNVLVVCHGNVLRCIISLISSLSADEMLRLQIETALPYTYSFEDGVFAQCCVLPPLDPVTSKPTEGCPLGLTSELKKGAVDSLI